MDPYIVNLLFDRGFNPDIIYFIVGINFLVIVGTLLSLVFSNND